MLRLNLGILKIYRFLELETSYATLDELMDVFVGSLVA
jgi:hypothetical protein